MGTVKMTKQRKNGITVRVIALLNAQFPIKINNMERKGLSFATVLLSIVIAVFSLGGCAKDNEPKEITFPPTSVLNVQSNWGVINSSHLRIREKPTTDSKAITTLWRGYVLEILSRTSEKEVVEEREDYWYQINYEGLSGWVFGAYLDIYRSKRMAEAAAEEIE
jgi:hypothetical protein